MLALGPSGRSRAAVGRAGVIVVISLVIVRVVVDASLHGLLEKGLYVLYVLRMLPLMLGLMAAPFRERERGRLCMCE